MKKKTRLEFLHALVSLNSYSKYPGDKITEPTLYGIIFAGQQTGLIPQIYTFPHASRGYSTPNPINVERDLIALYKKKIIEEPDSFIGAIPVLKQPRKIRKYVKSLAETISNVCPDKIDLFNFSIYLEYRRARKKLRWKKEHMEKFEKMRQTLEAFAA